MGPTPSARPGSSATTPSTPRSAPASAILPPRRGTDALAAWRDTPAGVLALAILLDQFPRNLHRGSAEAFAADPIMRDIARDAVLAPADRPRR